MPSLVEIGPVVLEKKIKMEKFTTKPKTTTTTTDNGKIFIRKANSSLQPIVQKFRETYREAIKMNR